MRFHDIEAELAAKIGVKEGAGVQLTRVNDQSPAAKCGLKVNDVILTIADKPVHGGDELQKIVSGLPLDPSGRCRHQSRRQIDDVKTND